MNLKNIWNLASLSEKTTIVYLALILVGLVIHAISPEAFLALDGFITVIFSWLTIYAVLGVLRDGR